MQFTFGDKREVYLLDESALPVTGKERRGEGESSIGPRMKERQFKTDAQIQICVKDRYRRTEMFSKSYLIQGVSESYICEHTLVKPDHLKTIYFFIFF